MIATTRQAATRVLLVPRQANAGARTAHLLLFVTNPAPTGLARRSAQRLALMLATSVLQVNGIVSSHALRTALTQTGTRLSAVRT